MIPTQLVLYIIYTHMFFFPKGPCKWEWDDKVAPIRWWIFSKNNIFTKNDIHTESNLVKVLAHNKLFFFGWKYYSVQQNSTISTKHSPQNRPQLPPHHPHNHHNSQSGTPKSTWVLWLVLILNRGLWVKENWLLLNN